MQVSGKNLGFGILILLALILAFIPDTSTGKKSISNQALIEQLQQGGIYVQADELAHWIIDQDPGFQLIDVRSAQDYGKYNIPHNEHIPFEKLTSDESEEILDNDKMIILASNGNTRAGQAWILLKQMGYDEVYILAGGLNNWVQAFNNPKHPSGAYTDDELFTYQFRKAAGTVMMGTSAAIVDDVDAGHSKPKPVLRKRKKKKKKDDEGC